MNIWDHSRLSVKKFGGKEQDYYSIHKFIDSSKLFCFNAKHRLLLHNLWGIEMTILKFGDTITNAESRQILVRDIAAEHCKEDLNGQVPSLQDWLIDNEERIAPFIPNLPTFEQKELEAFVLSPLLKSNLQSSLFLTRSNFGVYLCKELLGLAAAKNLQQQLPSHATVQFYLSKFQFTKRWQFTPQQKAIDWLKANETK